MDSWTPPRYRLVEHPEFLELAAAFAGSYEQWDEIRDTIEYDLMRNPYVGEPVPGTQLYAQEIQVWPPLTICYTINDDAEEVVLLHIRMFDPPPGTEQRP